MKRMKVAAGLVAVLSLAACGGGGGGTEPSGENQAQESKTLRVWLMNGSAPEALVTKVNQQFESTHKGYKVKYEVQEWNGIQDKLTTALASKTPPDVVELGNTQTPAFSSEAVLAELDQYKDKLNADKWLEGLAATGVWEDKIYATPFYAANRVVAYRTDLFDKAGLKPPTTFDEWVETGKALRAKNKNIKDFTPLYTAGQNWYAQLSFIWDNGGEIAVKEGETWKATLDTPEAQKGFENYKTLFTELGSPLSPADRDEGTPQQFELFAKGNIGMMISAPWEIGSAVAANKKLEGKVSAFSIPGQSGPAPVFLGGSNLAVPAGSANADAAADWLSLMLSDETQKELASTNKVVPGITGLGDLSGGDPIVQAMLTSSQNGKVTPADPRWASVEAGTNPIKEAMTAVLSGSKPVDAATKDASTGISEALNAS